MDFTVKILDVICIVVLVQIHPDSAVKYFAVRKISHCFTKDVLKPAVLQVISNHAMIVLGKKHTRLISDTYIFKAVYQKGV